MSIPEEQEALQHELVELAEEQARVNASLWHRLWHGREHYRKLADFDRRLHAWLEKVTRALEVGASHGARGVTSEEKKAVIAALARADGLLVRWRKAGMPTTTSDEGA